MVRSCTDIPVDSSSLVFYLKDNNCLVKSPVRPFHEIEKSVACTIIDLREETMSLPPSSLMDTGYDAGCADIAHIPLILLMDKATSVPKEWLMCEHVYKSSVDEIKYVVDIFIKSIKKYQDRFDVAERADIVSRLKLRQGAVKLSVKAFGCQKSVDGGEYYC